MRSEAEIRTRFEELSQQADAHAAERGEMLPEHRVELKTLRWVLDSDEGGQGRQAPSEEVRGRKPPDPPIESRDDYY